MYVHQVQMCPACGAVVCGEFGGDDPWCPDQAGGGCRVLSFVACEHFSMDGGTRDCKECGLTRDELYKAIAEHVIKQRKT